MKTAIIGASGYSGEELIRLLSQHPKAELCVVTSRAQAGKRVSEYLPKLDKQLGSLKFTNLDAKNIANDNSIEVVFLALPHGVSFDYAFELNNAGKVVIDLSADFRLNSSVTYKKFYGISHPYPELLSKTPYVIPEINKSDWIESNIIACPGCYPTSILIPLIPLIRLDLIESTNIIINSYSGISGAGKKLSDDLLFCKINENLKAYGLPNHRHKSEIQEQLNEASSKEVKLQFCPHLAPINRGIQTTIVVPTSNSLKEIYNAWYKEYKNSPFINILDSGIFPQTQNVVGTNRIDFSAVFDQETKNLIINSTIDNLLKGASGQAVQIFNKKFGFPETTGLI